MSKLDGRKARKKISQPSTLGLSLATAAPTLHCKNREKRWEKIEGRKEHQDFEGKAQAGADGHLRPLLLSDPLSRRLYFRLHGNKQASLQIARIDQNTGVSWVCIRADLEKRLLALLPRRGQAHSSLTHGSDRQLGLPQHTLGPVKDKHHHLRAAGNARSTGHSC